MRILGIDPGIGRTGWGIIDSEHGRLTSIDYGCIETVVNSPVPERLLVVYSEIQQIIERYKPDELGIEELFFNTNAKTALVVGQSRGVVLLAAARAELSIAVYTPLQVKMALTGYGRAEKKQIGQMVQTVLKLEKIPRPDDVADALAVAITHAFSFKLSARTVR